MTRSTFRSRLRRLAVRGSIATLVASGLAVGVGPSAHAAAQEQMVCTAGGAVTIAQNAAGAFDWVLSGVGACTVPDHPAQARQVTLAGTATTDSLGLCSNAPLINAFAMQITATFVSLSSDQNPISTQQRQLWSLPATTFPIASAFGIVDAAGASLGAGEFETHIFAQCPPGGQPTMQVNWVQSLV